MAYDVEFREIDQETIDDVARLLYERNQTSTEYVHWKYARSDGKKRGIVAYRAGSAVGCLGLIPKILCFSESQHETCGWFADWFVIGAEQGRGVGTELLNQVAVQYPIVFGHPAPAIAQNLCLKNGFVTLGHHQQRYRHILRPYSYYRRRSRFPAKILYQTAKSCLSRFALQPGHIPKIGPDTPIRFCNPDDYRDWIISQPIRRGIVRQFKSWSNNGLRILYCDDDARHIGVRRKIFTVDDANQVNPNTWRSFLADAYASSVHYVECFTTDIRISAIWASFGALSVPEPPILVKGLTKLNTIMVQGWDRENWLHEW